MENKQIEQELDFFKKEGQKISKLHDFLIKTTAFAYHPHKLYVLKNKALTESEKALGYIYAIGIWSGLLLTVGMMVKETIKML